VNVRILRAAAIPVSYLPRSGPVIRRLTPKSGPVVRQRFRGGAFFDLDLNDRMQAESFLRRDFERAMTHWIIDKLGRGDIFVDVGANVGLVSFTAAMSGARVIAFEPSPENCARWRRNRDLNPAARAELIEVAVGAEPGTVRLTLGRESGWNVIDRPTGPKIDARGSVEVRQIRLDDWAREHDIHHIRAMKVDVEGYEAEVLRGASRLLEEGRIDVLICELNDGLGAGGAQTLQRLTSLGYRREPLSGLDSAFIR
jgi:FkbM family methyltransferase